MKAIILAGEGKKEKHDFLQDKAIIPMKGIPMIQYIINSLKTSEYIEELLVVGNLQHLEPIVGEKVDLLIPQGASMMDNLLEALSHCKEEDQVLIATCDIPLIHNEVVNNFVASALEMRVDVCYPIVEKSSCESYYPDTRRTYASLKDGVFTGGNMMLLSPLAIDKIQQPARLMIKNRKNPVKMCRILGFKFIVKLLLRTLSIADLENYIEERFGVRARAIISPDPEIANDIDDIEDIKLLEKYL